MYLVSILEQTWINLQYLTFCVLHYVVVLEKPLHIIISTYEVQVVGVATYIHLLCYIHYYTFYSHLHMHCSVCARSIVVCTWTCVCVCVYF